MPIYNFQCEQCAETFEVRATFKEKEAGLEPECPLCHSKETHQMITAGLVLRSSGGANLPIPGCGPNAGPGCC
jgi:putative FmdB family regulatory protein